MHTLQELANAIGNDANFISTINNQIALKRNREIFKLSINKAGIQENDMLRKVAIDMKTFRARENKMQF